MILGLKTKTKAKSNMIIAWHQYNVYAAHCNAFYCQTHRPTTGRA